MLPDQLKFRRGVILNFHWFFNVTIQSLDAGRTEDAPRAGELRLHSVIIAGARSCRRVRYRSAAHGTG